MPWKVMRVSDGRPAPWLIVEAGPGWAHVLPQFQLLELEKLHIFKDIQDMLNQQEQGNRSPGDRMSNKELRAQLQRSSFDAHESMPKQHLQ
jgi:hypothetical protein